MSKPTIITISIIVAVIVMCGLTFRHLFLKSFESRKGPRHVFAIKGPADILNESAALDCAKKVLVQEGLTNDLWRPVEDGITRNSDDRQDVYLSRNTQHSRRGTLVFQNLEGELVFLTVELEGTNLIVQRFVEK